MVCALALTISVLNKPLPLDIESGEAYFLAGRKRLGILDISVEAAQCHYLAGLFHKSHLRTMAAWNNFQQSAQYTQMLLSGCQPELTIKDRHLLDRLFFSNIRMEG